MTAITIGDVPDDTVNALKVRAAQAGKSLQAYALELLSREAVKPTLAEMATRLEREPAPNSIRPTSSTPSRTGGTDVDRH